VSFIGDDVSKKGTPSPHINAFPLVCEIFRQISAGEMRSAYSIFPD